MCQGTFPVKAHLRRDNINRPVSTTLTDLYLNNLQQLTNPEETLHPGQDISLVSLLEKNSTDLLQKKKKQTFFSIQCLEYQRPALFEY